MPGYTLYKRIFAQLLVLCVCLATANTCPNRKLITAETYPVTVLSVDSGTQNSHSVCSKGISKAGFREIFKTDSHVSLPGVAAAFPLNLLNGAQGMAFYSPSKPRCVIKSDPCPLFLRNGVLIV